MRGWSHDEINQVPDDEGYEGVATAVMAAAVQRRKATSILNIQNRGAIGGLRDDEVVEVTCLVDEHGAHPIAQGEMPEAALALVSQVKVYERLTVTAAVEGSYDAAFEALLSHPLVASYPVAKTVLDGYIEELTGLLHLSVSGRSCLDLTAGCPRLPGKSRTMSRC